MNHPCSKCSFPLEKDIFEKYWGDGDTVLMIAGCNGHPECVKAWIEAGADVNAMNSMGETPFMQTNAWGHEHCSNVLLKAGADVNVTDNDGWTALMWASCHSNVEALLQAGSDPEVTDKEGETALMLAARHGFVENIGKLLATGVGNIDSRQCRGRTAWCKLLER